MVVSTPFIDTSQLEYFEDHLGNRRDPAYWINNPLNQVEAERDRFQEDAFRSDALWSDQQKFITQKKIYPVWPLASPLPSKSNNKQSNTYDNELKKRKEKKSEYNSLLYNSIFK